MSGRRQNHPCLLSPYLTPFVFFLTTQYNVCNFALMWQMSASVTNSALLTGSVILVSILTQIRSDQPRFEISEGCVDGMGGAASVAFAALGKAWKEGGWVKYSISKEGWIEEKVQDS
jgi:hypothetical protein